MDESSGGGGSIVVSKEGGNYIDYERNGDTKGLQSSQVNCNNQLPEILFTTLCDSFIHILIYKRYFLPSNNKNPPPLYIPFYEYSLNWFLYFSKGKKIPI